MRGPGRGPGRQLEKAKDFKGTTKKLIKNYLVKYKIALIIVKVCLMQIRHLKMKD